VRIPYANIPTQASRIPSSPPAPPASKSLGKRQILEAQDSYTRNGHPTSAQVIDAEYVEFYTPSTRVFAQERQNLDLAIETNDPNEQSEGKAKPGGHSAIDNYLSANTAPPPPPGTYINTFA